MLKKPLLALIRFYQKKISPGLGNRCRFIPTCSQYAYEAIEVYGAFKGVLLAVWRVLRCNPFGKTGYDPIPPKKKPGGSSKKFCQDEHDHPFDNEQNYINHRK